MKRHQMKRLALAAALTLAVLECTWAANPYVVLPNGRKVEGTEVRATREGQIILTTPEGRSTFDPGTQVVMDAPAAYTQAVQQLKQKQFAEAADLLKKVVSDYQFLGWDLKANRLLPGALVGQGRAAEAVPIYEELFKAQPDAERDEAVRSGYLRALAATGAAEKLEPILDQAIRGGPRPAAAVAQVLRGDVRMARDDIEDALLDYLRTAEFFRDAPEVVAEATFKTAECFEKLRDSERATAYYSRVVTDFPDSPYASRAKAKVP
jgi:TolA-binding protein